ncbi:unnamed protein product [Linum tenue]|uniref:SHSP domain-containing protein n=1 Tax=Linum tenue TaxID=586396 RepID=A0AAV0PLZ6_9ROSI|nr:unnamed protein product [Linum tenue]
MASAAAAPEPLSADKESSIGFAACAEPPAHKSSDDAKQEANNEDASFKSRRPDDSSADDGTIVPNGQKQFSTTKHEEDDHGGERVSVLKDELAKVDLPVHSVNKKELAKSKLDEEESGGALRTPGRNFLLEPSSDEGYESGTEEEQLEFMKEVETFYRDNHLEFKAPKFYKEELNLLKTCTTVSWTFRIFYEKALFEYEKHKMRNGELPFSDGISIEATRPENQSSGSLGLVPGRAPRRDAAARAMQGWHSQRLLGNGEVSQPVIKDKNLSSIPKVEKPLKTNGLLKRKKLSSAERAINVSPLKTTRTQADSVVIDVGPPADWVKVNVQRTNDCYEVYALVPGLLREEVHVQSDAAGRLVISGQPEQLENPWGVTPFKKVSFG